MHPCLQPDYCGLHFVIELFEPFELGNQSLWKIVLNRLDDIGVHLVTLIAEDVALLKRDGQFVFLFDRMDFSTFQLFESAAAHIPAGQAQPKGALVDDVLRCVRATLLGVLDEVCDLLQLQTGVMFANFHDATGLLRESSFRTPSPT